MIVGAESQLVEAGNWSCYTLDISTEVSVPNETAYIARYAVCSGSAIMCY